VEYADAAVAAIGDRTDLVVVATRSAVHRPLVCDQVRGSPGEADGDGPGTER
jgi:hypothetical protein